MQWHIQPISRLLFGCLCALAVALLLAGCSLFGGDSGTTAVTPTPQPTPVTYTGDGFTMSYPKTWKVNHSSTGVTFNDPGGIAYLSVRDAVNPNGLLPARALVNTTLQAFKTQARNYKSISLPATTNLAGESWSQGGASGDVTPAGQKSEVNVRIVVDADNHPAGSPSTRAYAIGYATGSQVFDLANTVYFQPMLQSFKFTG